MAGGKSKESVYITVEALGVKQSAEEMHELLGPLSDISKSITALLQQQQSLSSATVKVDKMIVQSQSTLEKVTGKLAQQSQTAAGAQSALAGSLKICSAAATGTKSSLEGVSEQGAKGMDVLGKLAGSLGGPVGSEINKVKNLFEGLKGASSGAAGSFVKFAAVAGGLALAIGAIVKVSKSCLDAYSDLNPEARTFNTVIAETQQSADNLDTALHAVAGEALDTALTPALEDASAAFLKAKKEAAVFFATLTQADKKNKQSGFATMVQGTIGQTIISAKKFFGMDTKAEEAALNDLTEGYYQTRKTAEEKLDENIKKLQNRRKQRTKTNIKDNAKAVKDEYAEIAAGIDLSMDDSGNIWVSKLLGDFENLSSTYAQQLEELDRMQGDPAVKAAMRLQLEADYENKAKDLRLQNAKETGDQEYILQQQYNQQKLLLDKQKADEEIAAFKAQQEAMEEAEKNRIAAVEAAEEEAAAERKQKFEWVESYVTGPLSTGIADLITSSMEGTNDLGTQAMDMMYGIAKNIFSTSLSNLINAGLLAIMNQYESNSKLGLPGLAIATAASGIITGIMAGLKAKLKPPSKAQMSVGGYVSQGMVYGAGGSGDSVEAVLQPGERVLSKEETKAYDSAKNQPTQINNFYIQIQGGFDKATIQREVRQYLIPEINLALGQGYKLAPA